MNDNQTFDSNVAAVFVAFDGVLYRFDRQAPVIPNARDQAVLYALLDRAAEQVREQIEEGA